jgi:pimeloyl-ACP methyl ester carboxylesterase
MAELVLVHGTWGSPEMWTYVVESLGDVPYAIRLADLPTTNRADATFADDVTHVRSIASGQSVVLCGHSYGCTVITAAGADLPNAVQLVYVAGWALDDGETSADWYARRPGVGRLSFTDVGDGRYLPHGWGDDNGHYDAETLAKMRSIELRPQARSAPVPMSNPAWRRVPSTFVVTTSDSIVPTDFQREMAERAKGRVIEIDCDHMVNLAAPAELAAAIDSVMSALPTGPAG